MKSPYKPALVEYSKSSTKRKKSSDTPTSSDPPTTTVVYSTRTVVPWKEQRALPEKFWRVGRGNWPVLRINDERIVGKKKEYLVEWESHPNTGEIFQPTWVRTTCRGSACTRIPLIQLLDSHRQCWCLSDQELEDQKGRQDRQGQQEAFPPKSRTLSRQRGKWRTGCEC